MEWNFSFPLPFCPLSFRTSYFLMLRMTATIMMMQPRPSRRVSCSPSTAQPPRTANTYSRLMSNEAMVGLILFWATICKVKATPLESTAA